MGVLFKLVALIMVAIAAFLIYAIIHAAASAGGARVGVCIAYGVAAVLLCYGASWLWRRSRRPATGV